MPERDAPSADAVKLVDAAIEAACTWQEHGDTTDIDNEDNAVAARAALLDYIAGLKAEIEAAVLNRSYYADQRKQAEAELAAKDAEIERLKSELVDEATAHLSTMNNADAAEADLARLKAAQVPEELRRLSEAASLMDDGPVSWTKFCVAAGRWVRSLLAAQPAPAPARQGPSATDVIEDRKVYDHECSRLLAKMDSLLHDLEAQSGSVGERAAEAHVALHELCTRLVDNEIAWPARQDSDAVAMLRGGQGIYIASKAIHGPRWRELRDSGIPIISTWIDEAEAGRTSDFVDLWHRCVSEAAGAKAVVVYREPGEVLKGALIEVGCALAVGRPVFTAGEMDGSWPRHPLVSTFLTLDEALRAALNPTGDA